jgi:hypothetical protein
MSGVYKDSLFRSLFNNKEAFLSLYNAVSGKNYDENTEVVINTLVETLFTMRKNDVSGIIAKTTVVIAEHQSSLNENMPFRFLSHIARLFENSITDKSSVYRRKLINLPRPEFIVLCKGPAISGNTRILRLSDAFEAGEGGGEVNLELAVKLFNINKGYNCGIVEKCPPLRGYVEYVDIVEETQKRIETENSGMDRIQAREKAIADAIVYCKKHNILKDFFEKLSPEEVNMLTAEWNLDDAIKVAREEGREEGREEDRELFSSLIKQSKSMDDLKKMFESTFTRQS